MAKTLRGLLAVAVVLGASGWAIEGRAADLSIDEAIRLALQNNERARIAALQIDSAEGDVETARASFLPTLSFGAQAQLREPVTAPQKPYSENNTLTLKQPLLNLPAIPSYQRSKHALESAKHSALDDQRQLAFDTAKAFLQALAAERVEKAAEGRVDRAKANLENADARAQAQLNSTNDSTRAKSDLSSAMRSLVQSKGSLAEARLALGLLVGREINTDLAAPDTLSSSAESFAGGGTDLVKGALARRPDVLAAHEDTLAAKASADEPLYRLAPSLDLTGQVQANPDPAGNNTWHSETATLNLSWTIFDGGTRYGDRRKRAAQLSTAELNEKQLARTVDNKVKTSLVALETAKLSLTIAEDSVKTAQQNSEETEILYKSGLARAIELTDANASLFDAEVELASAKLTLVQAFLDVRSALGQSPVDGVLENGPADGRQVGGK